MKKKFSFNLAPVKVPSKTETKSLKSPSHKSPLQTLHQRTGSISPPPSPFINRRPLTPKTEQQLRNACALILQEFKPSGHVFEQQANPKLDADGATRSMKEKDRSARSNRHREPHNDTQNVARDGRKSGQRHETVALPDSTRRGMQANTSRRRGEQQAQQGDREHTKASQRPTKSFEHTRVVPIRAAMDTDDSESLQTPLTGSTENQLHNASTAPTSAAVTSPRSSKRASHHLDNPAAVADAAAAEWMKQELEKKRHQVDPQSQSHSKPLSRAPSRSKSIRSGLREYFYPGSAAGSRSITRQASIDSLRSGEPNAEPTRSNSTHGWRSWSLQRKTSLSSFRGSRPTSSKGRSENKDAEPAKPELDLNRELPPLPSLDTWEQQEQRKAKKEAAKSAQGTHIADLMRPREQDQRQYAAAARPHHKRSESDSLAKNLSRAAEGFPMPPLRPTQSSNGPKSPPKAPATTRLPSDDMLKVKGHKHSKSSTVSSPNLKFSMDHSRLDAPNFSRKISADMVSHSGSYQVAYPNVVEISAAGTPKDEKSSKLRKVFSNWMVGGKKDKKGNWMDHLEQNGIKGGIMIQDEAAMPPVVRY